MIEVLIIVFFAILTGWFGRGLINELEAEFTCSVCGHRLQEWGLENGQMKYSCDNDGKKWHKDLNKAMQTRGDK